jgi:acetyl-CoA carboxylase biotin carboxylase subunit
VRVDTHVYSGSVVPPFYDSMLAKIIVTGRTRESAILRMERALSETRIEGVKTTVEFCREIMRDEEFQHAGLGVDWLPRYLAHRVPATV